MIYLILFFGLILRLISLNQSFWLDEATSAVIARGLSFSDIFTKFSPADFHPPLYYLILKVWTNIFGISEVSSRALSFVFGLATVYVVFLLGKKLFNARVGVIAALLLATSGLHIYYSQEARMYTMAAFFTSLAVYFFTRVEEGNNKFWLFFSLILAIIFLTDYLPITVLVVFWIYSVIFHRNFTWWRNFLLSHTPLVIVIVLWLPTFLKQLGGGLVASSSNWGNILGRTTFKEVLLIPTKFMIGRVSLENKLTYSLLVSILFLGFGFLIFKVLKDFKKRKITLVALWLFLPVVVITIIGLKIPVLAYFRLLFVLPAFYLLLAMGISKLPKNWELLVLTFVLAVNLVSSFGYLLDSKFQREDWRGLVKFIESERSQNSLVLFPANSQMEAYKFYAPSGKISGPEGFDNQTDEFWLIRYVQTIFDPEDKIRFKIEDSGFTKTSEYNFNGVIVWKYSKNDHRN